MAFLQLSKVYVIHLKLFIFQQTKTKTESSYSIPTTFVCNWNIYDKQNVKKQSDSPISVICLVDTIILFFKYVNFVD